MSRVFRRTVECGHPANLRQKYEVEMADDEYQT